MFLLVRLLLLLMISLRRGGRPVLGSYLPEPCSQNDSPDLRKRVRTTGVVFILVWLTLAGVLMVGVFVVGARSSRNKQEATEKAAKAAEEREQQRRDAFAADPYLPLAEKYSPPKAPKGLLAPRKKFGR